MVRVLSMHTHLSDRFIFHWRRRRRGKIAKCKIEEETTNKSIQHSTPREPNQTERTSSDQIVRILSIGNMF